MINEQLQEAIDQLADSDSTFFHVSQVSGSDAYLAMSNQNHVRLIAMLAAAMKENEAVKDLVQGANSAYKRHMVKKAQGGHVDYQAKLKEHTESVVEAFNEKIIGNTDMCGLIIVGREETEEDGVSMIGIDLESRLHATIISDALVTAANSSEGFKEVLAMAAEKAGITRNESGKPSQKLLSRGVAKAQHEGTNAMVITHTEDGNLHIKAAIRDDRFDEFISDIVEACADDEMTDKVMRKIAEKLLFDV